MKKFLAGLFTALFIAGTVSAVDAAPSTGLVRIVDTGAENFSAELPKVDADPPVAFGRIYRSTTNSSVWMTPFQIDGRNGVITYQINADGYIERITISRTDNNLTAKNIKDVAGAVLNLIGLSDLEIAEILDAKDDSRANIYGGATHRRIWTSTNADGTIAIVATVD